MGKNEDKSVMRADRMLSEMGCGSRSDIKKAIKAGLVKTVSEDGAELKLSDPSLKLLKDTVFIFGEKRIVYEKYQYFLLNKPEGLICDRMGGRQDTVFGLFEEAGIRTDLSVCGRLDKDTSGILILTNDGEMLHKLISPSSETEKEYEAELYGELDEGARQAMTEKFKHGFDVPDSEKGNDSFLSRPALLSFTGSYPLKARVILTEGRYHQVRRMFAACGHEVIKLKRIREGALTLPEDLLPGAYIRLDPRDIHT
ncbi:MAG: pseudouridine synthase [Lachnospiraceae bacterium]|nr:pseudouridine synthase [Lachnospiraceae bacterium]